MQDQFDNTTKNQRTVLITMTVGMLDKDEDMHTAKEITEALFGERFLTMMDTKDVRAVQCILNELHSMRMVTKRKVGRSWRYGLSC